MKDINDSVDLAAELEMVDSLYRHLGKMCIRFQEVENALRLCLTSLVTPEDFTFGAILSNELSFKKLSFTLEALMRHKHEAHDAARVEQFGQVLSRARAAEQTRNQLIHSVWEEYPNPSGSFRRIKSVLDKQNRYCSRTHPVHPEEIATFCDELSDIARALVAFFEDPLLAELLNRLDKASPNALRK